MNDKNDDFYFSTDKNEYVPIKTKLKIHHTNIMNTPNKSNNKIGLVYNTDISKYQLKSTPKHMKIINKISKPESESESEYEYFDTSQYYSDISIPSEPSEQSTNSYDQSANSYDQSFNYEQNESERESVNSNPFKQSSKQNNQLDTYILNDINNSLSTLNTQVISICNKKKLLPDSFKPMVKREIIKILNKCS
jgi:hypothetical protein